MPRACLYILLLTLSVLLQHNILFLSSFQETPGDLGDARLVHYLLEFTYQSLFTGTSLWNPNYFYPASNVGAYTDVLPGVMPWYGGYRLLGISPGLAFQFWLITTTALNYLCALYLFNAFSKDSLTSLLAAFLFTIASPRTAQLAHPQLLFAGYCLLFVGAIVRLSTSSTRSDIRLYTLIAGAALILQCYSGFYNTWSLFFICSFTVIICGLFQSTRARYLMPTFTNLLRIPLTSLLLFGSFCLAIAPFYLHAKTAALDVGLRSYGEVHAALPRLSAWMYQGPFSLMYGWLSEFKIFSEMQIEHENRLGFGLISTACFLFSILKLRKYRYPQILLVLFSLIGALITVFPGGFTLWHYPYLYLPGTAAVRAVSRVSLLLSIIPSFFIASFLVSLANNRKRFFSIIALCLIAFEQVHTGPKYEMAQSERDIEQVVNSIQSNQARCQSFLLVVVRGKFPALKYHIDAMWAALQSGVPTLNGYSGNNPPHWKLAEVNLSSRSQLASLSEKISHWKAISHINNNICILVKESRKPLERFIM